MKLILRLLINAIALLAVTQIIPGFVVDGFYIALITAFILGLLNAIVRPVLILLTLPVNVLTLGLFTFVINAFLLWFVSTFIQGFQITNFGAAILAAIILWAIGILTNWFIKKSEEHT